MIAPKTGQGGQSPNQKKTGMGIFTKEFKTMDVCSCTNAGHLLRENQLG